MTEINILITSVSRKVWLVKAFQEALKKTEGVRGKVISADIDPLSAGLYFSDGYCLIPPSSREEFIPRVMEICEEQKISLIVPTRDAELMLFAQNKVAFKERGIEVMVSDPAIIETCRDKYKFFQFLSEHNFGTPQTVLPVETDVMALKYPVLVKPVDGSGGKGIYLARSCEECAFFIKYVSEAVIQEFVQGEEYTIDLFADFSGKVLSVVTRQRVEVVSGESYKGRTKKDPEMICQAKRLAEVLGIVGHVTMQCIKNSEGIKFIEVNPRFGGGAILGIQAGADTPALLLRLLSRQPVLPMIGEFADDLIMLRYTDDLYFGKDRLLDDKANQVLEKQNG